MKRVLIAGLYHETHTFVPGRTSLADFAVLRGPEMLRVARLYRLVVLGVVIVVVVLFMPRGIGGVLRDRMDRWKRGLQ